ncbi:proline racemase family protein, partial [Streptomyces sp. NPDC059456]|uniref:proline racemase family protein n=1 Tax=Streptomyces sp. NPDC059456 TaxID=3346838 RepID=UPI0036BC275A
MTAAAVRTVDYHTAGEPFRIVDVAAAGLPPVPGDTVAERCATAIGPGGSGTAPRRSPLDDVRRLLVQEPRGHAGMYGGFVVPPDDDGAHFGVLFWHKDGYSTAWGGGPGPGGPPGGAPGAGGARPPAAAGRGWRGVAGGGGGGRGYRTAPPH